MFSEINSLLKPDVSATRVRYQNKANLLKNEPYGVRTIRTTFVGHIARSTQAFDYLCQNFRSQRETEIETNRGKNKMPSHQTIPN
jgi:hypothetical protein